MQLASPCTRNFADKFADIQVTYVCSTYVRSYLYIAFLATGRTKRDEEVTEGQKGGQEKDKDGPRRAARERERDSRISQPRYADGYVALYTPAIICEIDNGYLRTHRV